MLALGRVWRTLARRRRCVRHLRTAQLSPASGNDRFTVSLAQSPRAGSAS